MVIQFCTPQSLHTTHYFALYTVNLLFKLYSVLYTPYSKASQFQFPLTSVYSVLRKLYNIQFIVYAYTPHFTFQAHSPQSKFPTPQTDICISTYFTLQHLTHPHSTYYIPCSVLKYAHSGTDTKQ